MINSCSSLVVSRSLKSKKLFLFSVFCFLSSVLLLVGCAPKQEKAGITIWHWMTDREEAFLELARRYEFEAGTKINFELYAPSDAYTQKVRAAAHAKTLPDIYGILGELRDFAAFIKAGHVVDLTNEMTANESEWKNEFFPRALAVNQFLPGNEFEVKPGIYGVPIDVTNIQMLYNKDLFKKAGLDPEKPPYTWEEFIYVGERLKEAGIQGLVSGWGEIWMIDCLASNFAFNIMGEEKVMATIRGEIPYTDPDWIRVFELFDEMSKKGILATGIVTMVNKRAEQIFANERAAMAFNGSWCVNVYRGINPELNYAAFLPPRVSMQHPMVIWGGAGSSFVVNANSENKNEAIKFLRWLTSREQQVFLARETHNLPSNRFSLEQIPPILAQFADDMDNTTHPNLFPVSEFPLVIEVFNKGIQSVIIGEKTPEELAVRVQQVKERELRRLKAERDEV